MSNFNDYYKEFWKERWDLLLEALKNQEFQVARKNLFSNVETSALQKFCPPSYPQCYQVTDSLRAELPRGSEGLLGFYIMDPASVWIANLLQVQPGDRVLDMCAAPGGKTLCLIEALRDSGELIANEPSPQRRERLMKVIQQYIPRTVRDRVRVSGKSGGLFSKSDPVSFDRILVDAPCSGERHLIANKKEMLNWTPSRSKRLAQEQYSLLSGALEALKPGGVLVYSTCSLSLQENDQVLSQLLKKKSDKFQFDEFEIPERAERTKFGVYFLPDQLGFGPLFASRMIKR